jgi:putative flippase GtrA
MDSLRFCFKQLLGLLQYQKLRYLLAGGWNTVFGFSVFVGLYYLLQPYSVHYIVVILASQVITITSAFFVYKFFVFKSKENPFYEYLRFFTVYLVGLVLNIAMMIGLVDFANVDPILSQAFAIILVIVFSYVSHKNFSFRAV